jgi:N-acetylglucosaminyldiphosphoundecaprenol N-acetyl-beta-D-mannosaminyltransferase
MEGGTGMESIRFFEFTIVDTKGQPAVDLTGPEFDGRTVLFVNPHTLVCALTDPELRAALMDSSNICDGVGLAFALRLLGHPVTRLTGPDCLHRILANLPIVGLRLSVLCPSPAVDLRLRHWWLAQGRADSELQTIVVPDMSVVNHKDDEVMVGLISQHCPRLIFTAFGSPRQEKWLGRMRYALPNVPRFGFGAALEFEIGAKPRAPMVIRRLGLEWLFRLVREPDRLLRRNLNSVVFIGSVLGRLLGGQNRWCLRD